MKKMLLIVFMLFAPCLYASTVSLQWDRTANPSVTGYYVYRSITSGMYTTPLNTTPVPQPAAGNVMYSDTTAVLGMTYFYIVRSVNAANIQSDNSNEVIAALTKPPAPAGLTIISITAINLFVDKQKVATGPPPVLNFLLRRTSPPRDRQLTVTIEP